MPVSHDLTSNAAVSAACEAFARDPGSAHGAVAREELHWYHAGRRAWLTWRSGAWVGWDAAGAECTLPASEEWTPWTMAFDGARAPFFTWFAGAQTNAAFNECDRHVLAGHGGILLETPAFLASLRQHPIVLPECFQRISGTWESCLSGSCHLKGEAFHFRPAGREKAFVSVPLEMLIEHMARPGALAAACPSISRRQLLQQSVLAAYVLRACGVACGDRVILLMPHCIEQMVWMLAAKRIGALYVSMPVNISLKARMTRSHLAPFSSSRCPLVQPSLFHPIPNLRVSPIWTISCPLIRALVFTPRHALWQHVHQTLSPARETSAHHPRR